MLITAWVGMSLASAHGISWKIFFFGTVGIALSAAGSAVANHLLEAKIDAKMKRTAQRPVATGRIRVKNAIFFAFLLSTAGLLILYFFVNPLTSLLTTITVFGYAIFYTLYLKRATPQNIVIGGLFGAMPPLLGWCAVSDDLNPYALLLVLIIFTWTPPHFWALAIYRHEDYQKAEIPMLPVTHGISFTKLCIVLYTLLLFIISLFPYITGMSGVFYLSVAIGLGLVFLIQSIQLYFVKTNTFALKTFNFSILYLLLLFAVLLIDHYL